MTLPQPCGHVAAMSPYRARGREDAGPQLPTALDRNENPNGPLPSVLAALEVSAHTWNRYPDHHAAGLRAALATHCGRRVEEITVGGGSVGLLQQIFTAYVDRGDRVLYGWPSFEMIPKLVQGTGGIGIAVPNRRHRFDMARILAEAARGPKLIVLTSPNTPTGTTVTHEEMKALISATPTSTLIVLDEAYHEYITDADAARGLELQRDVTNLVVLRTFSKAYGLAALRIGYLIAHHDVVSTIDRVSLPYTTSSLAQLAAIASLNARDELLTRVDATIRERQRVMDHLRDLGVDVAEPQANFVWLPVGECARQLARLLLARGVLVRCYAGDGIRVTIGAPADNAHFLTVLESVWPQVQ